MEYSRLALALILPWLAGALSLGALQKVIYKDCSHILHRMGYGLFVGLALLYLLIECQYRLTGTIAFWPITICLLVVSVLASAAPIVLGSSHSSHPAPVTGDHRASKILVTALLAWTIYHLAIVAIETLYRPVYPWDAWLNWAYRAKAWFYAGALLPMDAPHSWMASEVTAQYNVTGNNYPGFVPVMMLWPALALGYWSETLVKLPILLCAAALGMAMYGQCREMRIPSWLSLLGAYLLLSIPLVGTHLALGGQADIWMICFTGLGFVSLVSGVAQNKPRDIALGIAFIAFSVFIKHEGIAWLGASILTLVFSLFPRSAMSVALLVVASVAVMWLSGFHYLELPLLGGIGVSEGRVYVPLVGNYALMGNQLADDYYTNFISGNSWHLLWPLTIAAALVATGLPNMRLRRIIPSLLASLVLTQFLIFWGTEHGVWAEQWTAINRLPLHFSPALVFGLILVGKHFLDEATSQDLRASVVVMACGALLTCITWFSWVSIVAPETSGPMRSFPAEQFRIVSGAGSLQDGTGVIEQFYGGKAIISSGPIRLDADELKILRVHTSGDNQRDARFFWRRNDDRSALYSAGIGGRGDKWVDLQAHPQWHGDITEIGLFAEEAWGEAVKFHQIELRPQSISMQLRVLTHAIRDLPLWSQRSVNFLDASPARPAISPPLMMVIWLAATLLVALLLRRKKAVVATSVISCALAAWMMLDARWSLHLFKQASETIYQYAHTQRSYLDKGNDHALLPLAMQAKEVSSGHTARALVQAADPALEFEMLRIKYHLLPLAAYAHKGNPGATPKLEYDVIVLVKPALSSGSESISSPDVYAAQVSRSLGRRVSIVSDSPTGTIFRVQQKPDVEQDDSPSLGEPTSRDKRP